MNIGNFKIHKETIGLWTVAIDIISVLLIFYFFRKLKALNQEYLEIIDNNLIKMSSFTVEIHNLILDKTMQDMRMLKMKIWLHFQNILDTKYDDDNDEMRVVDV